MLRRARCASGGLSASDGRLLEREVSSDACEAVSDQTEADEREVEDALLCW